MKKLFSTIILLSFITISYGQYGIIGGYLRPFYKDWEKAGNYEPRKDELFRWGWRTGVDYRIPLSKYKIIFAPELTYSSIHTEVDRSKLRTPEVFDVKQVSLLVKSNFYIFNLKYGCNCPEFSSKKHLIRNDFYLMAIPAAKYSFYNYNFDNTDPIYPESNYSFSTSSFTGGGGLGLGLDLWLNKWITVTAETHYIMYFGAKWESLSENVHFYNSELNPDDLPNPDLNVTNFSEYYAGIRLGFRMDKFYQYTRRGY